MMTRGDSTFLRSGFTFWTSRMQGSLVLNVHEQFNTVDSFVQHYAQHPIRDLPDKTCLHLFRQNIQPLWEDPKNFPGGHFKLTAQSLIGVENMWDTVVSDFVREALPEGVNGVSVMANTGKTGNFLIKVWIAVKDDDTIENFKNYLCVALNQTHYLKVTFVPHTLVLGGAGRRIPNEIMCVRPRFVHNPPLLRICPHPGVLGCALQEGSLPPPHPTPPLHQKAGEGGLSCNRS